MEKRKVPAGRARRRSVLAAGLGLRIAFTAQQDIRTIRGALDAGMHQQDAEPVKVSRPIALGR